MRSMSPTKEGDRFSISCQAGDGRPTTQKIRDSVRDMKLRSASTSPLPPGTRRWRCSSPRGRRCPGWLRREHRSRHRRARRDPVRGRRSASRRAARPGGSRRGSAPAGSSGRGAWSAPKQWLAAMFSRLVIRNRVGRSPRARAGRRSPARPGRRDAVERVVPAREKARVGHGLQSEETPVHDGETGDDLVYRGQGIAPCVLVGVGPDASAPVRGWSCARTPRSAAAARRPSWPIRRRHCSQCRAVSFTR